MLIFSISRVNRLHEIFAHRTRDLLDISHKLTELSLFIVQLAPQLTVSMPHLLTAKPSLWAKWLKFIAQPKLQQQIISHSPWLWPTSNLSSSSFLPSSPTYFSSSSSLCGDGKVSCANYYRTNLFFVAACVEIFFGIWFSRDFFFLGGCAFFCS